MSVRCNDGRECFAKSGTLCLVLNGAYKDGKCPFCKKDRDSNKKEKKSCEKKENS